MLARKHLICALTIVVWHIACAWPLLWERLQIPFYWPMVAVLPAVWFFCARSTDQISFGRIERNAGMVSSMVAAVCLLLGTPWGALCTLFLLSCVVFFRMQNASGSRRMGRLVFLPLLLTGFSPDFGSRIWNWWVSICTQTVSVWSSYSAAWNLPEGGTLSLLNGKVSVEEICSAFFSLWFLVLVSVCWSLWNRRSEVQLILLLANTLVIATAARIVLGVILSLVVGSGGGEVFSLLAHLATLVVTIALIMYADIFVSFLTDFVPSQEMLDTGRRGNPQSEDSADGNPLLDLWNRYVAASGYDAGQRTPFFLPNGQLVPVGASLKELASSWLISRNLEKLLSVGTLLLIFLVTAGSIVGARSRQSEMRLLYRSQVIAAAAAGDSALQELCLKFLISCSRHDYEVEQEYADFLWDQGRHAEAWQIMTRHAEVPPHGFAAAHLWLAKRAGDPNAAEPMAMSDVVRHLQQSLKSNPNSLEANRMLAELYMGRRNWKQAEHYLDRLVRYDRSQTLNLLRVRQHLGISITEDDAGAERINELKKSVSSQESVDPHQIQELVQLLLLVQRFPEALEVAESACEKSDSADLRTVLAALKISQATLLLNGRILQADVCRELVTEALQLHPENMVGIQLAAELRSRGMDLELANSDEIEQFWAAQASGASPHPLAVGFLASALEAAGKQSEAVDVLAAVKITEFAGMEQKVRLLMSLDRVEETQLSVEEFVAAGGFSDVPGKSRFRTAELYARCGMYEKSRGLLLSQDGAFSGQPGECSSYARCCLMEFDQLTKHPGEFAAASRKWKPELAGDVDVDHLMELLDHALGCAASRLTAVDRLLRLSLSDEKLRGQADRMLAQLRAEGEDIVDVLTTMGSRSLELGEADPAIVLLESANRLTYGRDPMLLNNLAVALVRNGGGENAVTALQLLNKARELDPASADVLASRGEVRLLLRDWNQAREDLQESLRLNPNQPGVHRMLAAVWDGLGLTSKARVERRTADLLESGLLRNPG